MIFNYNVETFLLYTETSSDVHVTTISSASAFKKMYNPEGSTGIVIKSITTCFLDLELKRF